MNGERSPLMSRRQILESAVGAAAALAGVGAVPGVETLASPSQSKQKVVLGWLIGSEPAGLASLKKHASQITHLSPTWYTMASDLSISGAADPLVVNFARQHGIALHPLIQNAGTDPNVARQILRSSTQRAAAAKHIANLVLQHNFGGINMDFEGTFGSSRDQYTDFIGRLVKLLRPHGKWVTVDVVPQLHPPAAGSWAAPYDYQALGAVCDAVVLMAYEYSNQTPGSIAPLWWVKQVMAYARARIAPNKLIVGLPFYGRHWTAAAGRISNTSVTQEEAADLHLWSGAPIQRPASDATPRFSWQSGSVTHTVHYEDKQSVAAMLAAVGGDMAGVAFWRLGKEQSDQWNAIGNWAR